MQAPDNPRAAAAADLRLDGRVAVVTGAAGGIARGIVERLALLGADLVLLDINDAGLAALPQWLAVHGRRVMALHCDVSDPHQVGAAAERVAQAFDGCDFLVNNAGVLPAASSIEDQSLQAWDDSMAVNVRGVFLCTQTFGRFMLRRRSGSIVNIASIGAQAPNASPPYAAAKAGVIAFTRQTAVEWGPEGVRANSVSPGFVRTPLSEHMYATTDMAQVRSAMVPVRRLGMPMDIAGVVAFLLSDAAAYVNGQDLQVDGGFMQSTLMRAQPPRGQHGGTGR
jgi:NAD(P)-dependent dehydrogenase (short-subunit alcohol dehydrogenase family)